LGEVVLIIGGEMKSKKVLVGLSGGVDSAWTACYLKKLGYEVKGFHMYLHDGSSALKEKEKALKIAATVGIEIVVKDYRSDFEEKVINKFIEGYLSGITPNPCIYCNYYFKYGKLIEYAVKEGFDYVSLGHYVIINYDSTLKQFILMKSDNVNKDQSYFLHGIKKEHLSKLLFPMSKIRNKETIKEYMKSKFPELNFKKESTDICFVGNKNYPNYIIKKSGIKSKPGYFVGINGNKLGKHKGIIYYTVGQKRGIGERTSGNLCVVGIDAKNNEVILGNESNLIYNKITLSNINIMIHQYLKEKNLMLKTSQWSYEFECEIKIIDIENDEIEIFIKEGLRAPEIGQGAVIYKNNAVVAGGIIKDIDKL
jgi:tRNA-specific 2-thiouridylase